MAGSASRDRGRRILVIDDSIDGADSLAEVLRLYGHHVSVAFTAQEGVALAESLLPDIVICDIGMPKTDGYQVASLLRRNPELAHARLIAMTGHVGAGNISRALEAGFNAHLAKPPDLDHLIQLLE